MNNTSPVRSPTTARQLPKVKDESIQNTGRKRSTSRRAKLNNKILSKKPVNKCNSESTDVTGTEASLLHHRARSTTPKRKYLESNKVGKSNDKVEGDDIATNVRSRCIQATPGKLNVAVTKSSLHNDYDQGESPPASSQVSSKYTNTGVLGVGNSCRALAVRRTGEVQLYNPNPRCWSDDVGTPFRVQPDPELRLSTKLSLTARYDESELETESVQCDYGCWNDMSEILEENPSSFPNTCHCHNEFDSLNLENRPILDYVRSSIHHFEAHWGNLDYKNAYDEDELLPEEDETPMQTLKYLPDISVEQNGECVIRSACLVSGEIEMYTIAGFDVKFYKSLPTSAQSETFTENAIRLDFSTQGFVDPDYFEVMIDDRGNIFVVGIIYCCSVPNQLWINARHCGNPDKIIVENPGPYYYTVEIPF